jgi:cytochrome c peroxidase
MKHLTSALIFMGLFFILGSCQKDREIITVTLPMEVELGKNIFFDKSLSNPMGQSCSSCHDPKTGFSDLNHSIVSEGAVDRLFGNRNAPTISYIMFSPELYYDNVDSTYVGGYFLDGRTNSLEDQAKQPFLNKLEMNNATIEMVVSKLQRASYYSLYKQVYGEVGDVNEAFNNMTTALAAYERSDEFNPFTSKYDYFLKGQASLTTQELNGLKLFKDTAKAKCANCHPTEADEETGKIYFTDFTYDNIGVPKNTNNPFYSIPSTFNPLGPNYIDYGLGGFVKNHDCDGQFKVPTLRNSAISAPYFHNGFFNTLEEVVHFYNVRDSLYKNPEIPGNVNKVELGKLKLTPQEEKDVVAFLKTLTDGYK